MSACPSGRTRARSAPRREDARPRGGERGVSWVSLLLLVLLVGGGYLAWVWVPVYFVHYEVKQVVRDHMNQAIKDRADARLVERMVQRIARLDTVPGLDRTGAPELQPAIVIDPREVSWERDTSTTPAMLRVSFVYEREVAYPLLDRVVVKAFAVDLENELTVPDWGPSR